MAEHAGLSEFDGLLGVDDKVLQEALENLEPKTIALALKITSDDLTKRILRNVGEEKKAEIEIQYDLMGPKTLGEIDGAQRAIVDAVKNARGGTEMADNPETGRGPAGASEETTTSKLSE